MFILALIYFAIFFVLVALMLESITKLTSHVIVDKQFTVNYIGKWSGLLFLGIFLLALSTIIFSAL